MQENEVEVGAVAEFLAAKLAVGDDGEFRRAFRLRMAVPELLPAQVKRGLYDDVGEQTEMVGEPLDCLHAGDVLRQQAENLRMMGFAQDIHFAFGVAGDFG